MPWSAWIKLGGEISAEVLKQYESVTFNNPNWREKGPTHAPI
jgi:hypothetical protein